LNSTSRPASNEFAQIWIKKKRSGDAGSGGIFQTENRTMKLFTLYVGTTEVGAKAKIIHIVTERFSSFTLMLGEGFFRGTAEPVWMVKIATEDCQSVIETAAQIRQTLEQDGVGIECDGNYYRCTQADPATALRKAWQEREFRRISDTLL
jgi:hypothetical protein